MADDPKSSFGSPTLVLAAAVFAVFTGFIGGSGPTDRKATSPDAASPADKAGAARPDTLPTVSAKDPRRPFQEFWEVSASDAGKELAEDLIQHSDTIAPEFLIALVPDPIDSRLSYRFDAIVDDVQMAVESLGWNLDRFWLPWQPSGQQPARRDSLVPIIDSPPDSGKAFSLRLFTAGGPHLTGRYGLPNNEHEPRPGESSALHEREPGVLIFRKPRADQDERKSQQIMIVFLVGERPTSGIHKAALGKALNIIEFVKRGTTTPEAMPTEAVRFPIVGPYFSGSERSLELVISDWTSKRMHARPMTIEAALPAAWRLRDKSSARVIDEYLFRRNTLFDNELGSTSARASRPIFWRFSIRSGGANHVDRKKIIRNSGDDGKGPAVVEFDATLHHFHHVMRELFRFLRRQNGHRPLGKVALLTESDTQFGRLEEPRNIRTSWDIDQDDHNTTITVMKFPFHISQVAAAYDQNRQADEKGAAPALARPSSKLRIPFDETGSPRDIVPSLSPGMSSASDEFDLAKILETIAMEDYRYVGIVATDTRDVIFLSALVREYCPDVQLFSPVGDLLLGHPTYASQLRGMIVASPYPLFSMAQRWDPPYSGDHRRHLFMHESDQGYYNATLSLLGAVQKPMPHLENASVFESSYYSSMFDYGRPFDEMYLLEKAREDGFSGDELPSCPPLPEELEPPLWVGVVGQRGLWPLHFETTPGDRSDDEDFIFRPRPDDLGADNSRLEQFVPLIPQFSWFWGTIVLGLTAVTGAIYYAHWRIALRQRAPSGVLGLFRTVDPGGGDSRQRETQDAFVYAMIGVVGAVYGYFVAKPCRLAIRHSPWTIFLDPYRLATLSWGDYWNWQFGLVASVLAGAGMAALTATVAIRVSQASRRRRPSTAAVVFWTLSTVLLVAHRFVLPAVRGPAKPFEGDPPISLSWADNIMLACLVWLALPAADRWLKENLSATSGATGSPPPGNGLAGILSRLHFPAAVCLFFCAAGIYLEPPFPGPDVCVRIADAVVLAIVAFAAVAAIRSIERRKETLEQQVPILKEGIAMVAKAIEENQRNHAGAVARGAKGEAKHAAKLAADKEKELLVKRAELDRLNARLNGGPWGFARLTTVVVILLPLLAGFAMLVAVVGLIFPRAPYTPLLFLERALNLGNGVSPLVPVLLVGLTATVWLGCHLRRVDYIDRLWKDRVGRWHVNPLKQPIDDAMTDERKDRLLRSSAVVRDLIYQVIPGALTRNPACVLATGLAGLVLVHLYERFIPTVDGLAFNRAMILAFAALTVATVVTLCRFLLTWWAVRQLLREFALLPMQRAFDRVPKCVSREFGPYLNALQPRVKNLEIMVHQWALVADGFHDDAVARGLFGKPMAELDQARQTQLDALAEAFRETGAPRAPGEPPGVAIARLFERECVDEETAASPSESQVRAGLRTAAGACFSVLIPYWRSRSIKDAYGEDAPGSPTNDASGATASEAETSAGNGTSTWGPETKPWLAQVEDLLVLELTNFISECTIHLKNQAAFLAIGPLLLLLAATSYPFQPQRFLVVTIWTLLVAVAAGVIWAYVQMERNEVLSRISKTTPDRVSFNPTFLTHVAAVTIPLLGALLTQFPFVSDTLNQWLDPVVRILK
ncbi:MAG: hypothetical protein P4L84_19690 [Isosphaeraceae bacterium]|nr:hypothetical protein [Isosphaeraceae bacterium]